jgi:hypothetical protein
MMDFCLHNQDLKHENSDLVLCDNDTEAIAQAITIRLKTMSGEWFLDQSLGIPYLTEILGRKRSTPFLRTLILSQIESLPDIRAVKDFSIEVDAERTAHIKFSAVLSDLRTINFSEAVEL